MFNQFMATIANMEKGVSNASPNKGVCHSMENNNNDLLMKAIHRVEQRLDAMEQRMNVSLGKPKDVVIPDVPTVSIKHVDHPGHTCCKHVHGSTERCKNEFGRMVVPSNGQERWIKLPRGLVCKAMVRQHPGASVDVTYICINNHDQIIAIRGSTGEEVKVDVNPKPVDLNQSEQETTELVTPGVYTVVHKNDGIQAHALQWTGGNIKSVVRFLRLDRTNMPFRAYTMDSALGLLNTLTNVMTLFEVGDWILVDVLHMSIMKQTNAQLQNDWRCID